MKVSWRSSSTLLCVLISVILSGKCSLLEVEGMLLVIADGVMYVRDQDLLLAYEVRSAK